MSYIKNCELIFKNFDRASTEMVKMTSHSPLLNILNLGNEFLKIKINLDGFASLGIIIVLDSYY